jgi:hypothetical protein
MQAAYLAILVITFLGLAGLAGYVLSKLAAGSR